MEYFGEYLMGNKGIEKSMTVPSVDEGGKTTRFTGGNRDEKEDRVVAEQGLEKDSGHEVVANWELRRGRRK